MPDQLKLGFFIQPVHPPARRYADVLREDREAVVLADRLGYREAFIGEHLVDSAETITSSLAFIAHLADAEAIGDAGSDRNRKAQEAIEHMLRLWNEEPPYRIDGEFYSTRSVRSFNRDIGLGTAVRPLQRPHPPIAVTSIRPGGTGPRAAGQRGWSGISAAYIGSYVVRAHIDGYLEGRRAAGLSASTRGWRVARSIFVADDETTARRYAHAADGAHGFYFHVVRTKLAKGKSLDVMHDLPGRPDSELALERCLQRLVIAGTPKSVAAQILAFRREVGEFGTLLYAGHDWVEPALARRSMELMASEVLPLVNKALTQLPE